jgi:hypothetical protein
VYSRARILEHASHRWLSEFEDHKFGIDDESGMMAVRVTSPIVNIHLSRLRRYSKWLEFLLYCTSYVLVMNLLYTSDCTFFPNFRYP